MAQSHLTSQECSGTAWHLLDPARAFWSWQAIWGSGKGIFVPFSQDVPMPAQLVNVIYTNGIAGATLYCPVKADQALERLGFGGCCCRTHPIHSHNLLDCHLHILCVDRPSPVCHGGSNLPAVSLAVCKFVRCQNVFQALSAMCIRQFMLAECKFHWQGPQ